MSDRLTLPQAASRLHVGRDQLEQLVAAGWLAEPEGGRLLTESVEALNLALFSLEAGLLGLAGHDRPPSLVTTSQAVVWLGVGVKDLTELVDQGQLESVRWDDLSEAEVVEVVLAAEAAAREEDLSVEDALFVDTLLWKVQTVNLSLGARDRGQARDFVDEDRFYVTGDVRALARRRRRLNPPRTRASARRRKRNAAQTPS